MLLMYSYISCCRPWLKDPIGLHNTHGNTLSFILMCNSLLFILYSLQHLLHIMSSVLSSFAFIIFSTSNFAIILAFQFSFLVFSDLAITNSFMESTCSGFSAPYLSEMVCFIFSLISVFCNG